MDACNLCAVVGAGSFGRRVVSGPVILMNQKAHAFKEYTTAESKTQNALRRTLPPPPYTLTVRAVELEPGSYLASPVRPFPRRRKDLALKMRRSVPGCIAIADSCPPLVGLGLGVDFRRGEDPVVASDEEISLSIGTPNLTHRRRRCDFQAVHEYAKYARARSQIELGYVVPVAFCELEPLVAPKDEPCAPPEYCFRYPEANIPEVTETVEADYGYTWGCGFESQSIAGSESGASEVGGTVYYVRNIMEYGGMDTQYYHNYW